ncbi:MAG: hypothetical protein GY929_20705 [Actinomycetia bacterium]|nr:hypothetical protein [Actinomycetes bacterium]
MNAVEGFEWAKRKNGDVVIVHQGQTAAVLRGNKAEAFLEAVQDGDEQALMARLTGNYKRGNERLARQHPRNRNH